MRVTVRVPTPLRRLTEGCAEVEVSAATVAELIGRLEHAYPGIGTKLVDEHGALLPHVNLYVNNEDIRFLAGMDTKLGEGDRISVVPAMAGGC